MTAEMVLIWFLIGMVVSIGLGNKMKVNIGLIAMVFGYFLAVFGMGIKTSAYINMFPTKITFTIIGICWLFGYANENGTLRQITLLLVYKFRNLPSILPWVFFFISGVICMTGASPYAPNAVLMPIIISVCLATGLSPLFGALMVNMGAYIGSQVPWGQGASIQRGVLETSPYAEEMESIILGGQWSSMIFAIAAGVVIFVLFKGWKAKVATDFVQKPEPMTAKQKQTLALILFLIVLMVIPALLGSVGVKAAAALSRKLDISLVCVTLAEIAGILKVADDKVIVTRHIPWNTLMMLGGVSMLVGVASEGGAIDLIGTWIGANVNTALVVPLFVLLSAFMSIFAAGSSVVVPTVFALVPSVAAASGASYAAMYHGIAIGANASAVSPFSGGGALTLANIKQDDIREKMFIPLIVSAALLSVLAALLGAVGLYN